MTLRQSIEREVSWLSAHAQLVSLCERHSDAILSVESTITVTVKSKDQADRVASACGIPTMWRNGYYMAAKQFGRVLVEIHFAPLITSGKSISAGLGPGTLAVDACTDGGVQ